MADEKISAMTAASSLNDADVLPIVQSGANKKSAWSLFKSTLKTYFDTLYQTLPVVVTGNITAANDTSYVQTASATFSDPTPAEGKGYTVFVRNGTATIGGVTYAAGCLVYRFYHSGAWANTTYFEDSIAIVHQFTAGTNPNDATNYYIGAFPSLALTTSATARKSKLNGNYRIVAANIEIITAGTLGSSENSTLSIRLNNTTDVLVSNTVKFNAVLYQEFVTGLAIDILSTDDFQTKLLTATFATNPTTPYGTITYYAKRIS